MDARHDRSDFTNAKFDSGWSLRFVGEPAAKPEKGKVLSYHHRALILDEHYQDEDAMLTLEADERLRAELAENPAVEILPDPASRLHFRF